MLRVNESALVVCKIFPHPSLAFAIRDITKGPLYFYERTGQQSVPMSYNSIWQKISSYQRSVTQKCLLEELNRLMHNIELASKTIKDGKESIISVQKPMFLLTNLHLIGQYEGNDVVRDVLRIDQYISGVNYYLDGLRQLFFIKMSQPEHSNDYKLVIEEGVQQSLESLKDTLNIVLSLFNKIKKIN